jgi:hypothetical protein
MMTRLERRGFRRAGASEHGILSARVRPGRTATIIDISPGGASIEVACRLLPGTTVELRLDTSDHQADLKGCILRCSVVRLRSNSVSYRAAIAFDREWPLFLADAASEYPVPRGEIGPAHGDGVGPSRSAV